MTTALNLSSTDLGSDLAEVMLRAIQATADIRRRHQFFGWLVSYLNPLLPHQIAICGAWRRGQKQVLFEDFNSIVLPEDVLSGLVDNESVLMREIIEVWVKSGSQPCLVQMSSFDNGPAEPLAGRLLKLGVTQMLMHAVARPQRQNEIETIFVFAVPHRTLDVGRLRLLMLLMPHLHSTYLRVLATELEMNLVPQPAKPLRRPVDAERLLTGREVQILALIRDGMSNQQIAAHLSISALTVKNHVQKVLKKLGACNRAQAVVRAMALRVLRGADANAAEEALPSRRSNLDTAPVQDDF
ncbi:MAG: hypothetical protein H7Z19_01580 [Chitinophagaceae bacterium]|nr:hypothetical protein [Rubrivivax sp.]